MQGVVSTVHTFFDEILVLARSDTAGNMLTRLARSAFCFVQMGQSLNAHTKQDGDGDPGPRSSNPRLHTTRRLLPTGTLFTRGRMSPP